MDDSLSPADLLQQQQATELKRQQVLALLQQQRQQQQQQQQLLVPGQLQPAQIVPQALPVRVVESCTVPSLQTTLSHAAPDKAAAIRSAVTGALRHNSNGFFSFERDVHTTFVLPWDLNPRVEPERFSRRMCEGIRNELLDAEALKHLETVAGVNWNTNVTWSTNEQLSDTGWRPVDGELFVELEKGYHSASPQMQLSPSGWGSGCGFCQVTHLRWTEGGVAPTT